MKRTTVSATHSETLYTSLPGLEIEVRYFFTSEIETDEEDFEHEQTISGLMVSINGGPLQEYQTPSVITNNGRRFLATLRGAARKEAAKQQLAADATTMADYAAYLAEKKSLRAVVLSRHEADAGGLRFVVDGKWTE